MTDGTVSDVCVIGHGLAGGVCAWVCADAGLKVTVVTASQDLTGCNTYHAQGGIIYDRGLTEEDTQALIQDICTVGDGMCYVPAVHKLVELGSQYVDEYLLKRLEVEFDVNAQGEVELIREAAHSVSRIAHSKDHTGQVIQSRLNHVLLQHPNIRLWKGATAIDLLSSRHHARNTVDRFGPNQVLGCYVLDHQSQEVVTVYADATVLASGGLGQIYLHTTNPQYSRGDGIAMAYRSGARVENLEYVQFHPSAFFYKGKIRFLVSEALRGYGAVLRNIQGEDFMKQYHPLKDLAPRDVVSRAVYREMALSKHPCVYLDLSHLNHQEVIQRFPLISKACAEYGFQLSRDWIPVVPAAHYHCGGVWVDLKGHSSLDRLYAVGEVSCSGLHGANRLASTSLLECLVWGVDAAKDIVEQIQSRRVSFMPVASWKSSRRAIDPTLVEQDWQTLKTTLMNYVGVIRTESRLKRAGEMLSSFKDQVETFYKETVLTDELIGLRNASLTAYLVYQFARRNKTSVGCHTYVDAMESFFQR
jgi:L-aspartate oxidase